MPKEWQDTGPADEGNWRRGMNTKEPERSKSSQGERQKPHHTWTEGEGHSTWQAGGLNQGFYSLLKP